MQPHFAQAHKPISPRRRHHSQAHKPNVTSFPSDYVLAISPLLLLSETPKNRSPTYVACKPLRIKCLLEHELTTTTHRSTSSLCHSLNSIHTSLMNSPHLVPFHRSCFIQPCELCIAYVILSDRSYFMQLIR